MFSAAMCVHHLVLCAEPRWHPVRREPGHRLSRPLRMAAHHPSVRSSFSKPHFQEAHPELLDSLIWVVALPLQLSDSFRKRNPAVHRFMGYSIATMGIVLGITGILFPIRKHLTDTNITYSHPDFFHLHKLVLGGQTVLVWPTFDLALCVLFPAHMYSLYRTVNAARSRKYLEHRTWAVFHFITASLPSFLRIGNYTVIAVGYAIEHFASAEQKKQLGVPQDGPEQWRVEMAAFAFATWWIAGGIAVGWVAWLLRYRNMVWDQPASNSKAAVGEKGSKDVAGAL